jgi:hypothetical protein
MTPFLGLIASLLILLIIRRKFTLLLFDVLMGIMKNKRLVGLIYGFLFLPGVLLHEGSHWLVAKLLRVRTHRFSLVPTWVDEGTLRFGYVEMTKTDHFRASLVGLAPMVLGTAAVLLIALEVLALDVVFGVMIEGDLSLAYAQFKGVLNQPDVWLWMYLLITISNMMLPSASDRASWVPVGVFLALLLIPVILWQPDVAKIEWLNGLVEGSFKSLATAFGVTALLDLLLVLPLWVIDMVLGARRASS